MESENSTTEDMIAKTDSQQNRRTPPTRSGNTDETLQMGEPPEMDCDADETDCEMPEPPEGFDSSKMPSDIKGGFTGDFPGRTTQQANSDAILHPVAYLAIGGASVILGILVSYACFSKFFHLKPAQTFDKSSKFIWFTVVTLVIAAGLITLGYFIPVWCK